MRKKSFVIAMALVAILAIGLAVTIAYFTDKKEVTNTFTVGNLQIDLTETYTQGSKLLPGTTIPKDPKVTLKAGSEDAYVFMQLKPEGNIMTFLEPIVINTSWKPVTGRTDLYVYQPGAAPEVVSAGTVLPALFTEVKVKTGLDNAAFAAFNAAADKLTVKAFAHQAYINGALNYATAEAAAKVQLP